MRAFLVAISCILFSGCIVLEEAPGECTATSNECIEEAFLECRQYADTWKGENGEFDVKIVELDGDSCIVEVSMPKNSPLDISGKQMSCRVPLKENATFSILADCTGSLAEYFAE